MSEDKPDAVIVSQIQASEEEKNQEDEKSCLKIISESVDFLVYNQKNPFMERLKTISYSGIKESIGIERTNFSREGGEQRTS